ncbi:MAG TPA: tRNA pseudouridine(55) synthase TruB, partial [Dehalococcoidia bacterium]|nr:tRNA pseudouridine(55) synthase TruB [Dehalococcoidia bacterium]
TGVLPIAVGIATRLIEYLDDSVKVYDASVRLGIETDTYDADGQVVGERDASAITAPDVEAALRGYVGEIEQVPPRFSALKVAGKPMYRYAREGADVELRPRRVRIDAIALRRFEGGVAHLTVRCGPGTYIRSLAHDLGAALGCGAHLAALRRTASAGFSIEDAVTPGVLRAAAADGRLGDLILAPDRAVERHDALLLGAESTLRLRQGRTLALEPLRMPRTGDICRAYSFEGAFLGVVRAEAPGAWKPEKVLISG